MSGRRIAYLSVFLGLAMILSYVETLIPLSLLVPGMKIGLANLVTVFLLYRFRWFEAFLVSLCRVLLSALLFGTAVSLLFSMAGFLVSFIAMLLLKKTGLFRTVSVSVTGSVLHNAAQILTAMLVLRSVAIAGYLPVLFLVGIVSGALIGILSGILIKTVPIKL